MNQARRSAFTLIEVLIVVVIMAVLAATIIPQFSSSSEDAKKSALAYNLHTLRAQIQLYRSQHDGQYPTIANDANGNPSLPQLYQSTDSTGAIGTGASYPLGPYLVGAIPKNPFDDSNYVETTATWPPTAETANGGWLYHVGTGNLCPNTVGHLED